MKTNIVILLFLFAGAFLMSPSTSTPVLAAPTQDKICIPGTPGYPNCWPCSDFGCKRGQECYKNDCYDGPCEKE